MLEGTTQVACLPEFKASNIKPPKMVSDMVLSDIVKNKVEMIIKVANRTNEPPGHILLYGVPGSGKTTLANIIANAVHMEFIPCGSSTNISQELLNLKSKEIRDGKKSSMIFLDEVHSYSKKTQEQLLQMLEQNILPITIDGMNRLLTFDKNITFIGATTNPELLLPAFRSRFRHQIRFDYYSDDMIKQLALINLHKLNIKLKTEQSLKIIVAISRGIPRTLNNHLKNLRDFTIMYQTTIIDDNLMFEFLSYNGIEPKYGLTYDEVNYIKCFIDSPYGAKGRTAVESLTGFDSDTLNGIEAYLRRKEYIDLTRRGRMLTERGISILKDLI